MLPQIAAQDLGVGRGPRLACRAIGRTYSKSANHWNSAFYKLLAAFSACSPGSAAGSGNRAAFPGVFWAVGCVSGALNLGDFGRYWGQNKAIVGVCNGSVVYCNVGVVYLSF